MKKYEFDKFPEKLAPLAHAVRGLSEVELDRGALALKIEDDRLLRIFSRKFHAAKCVVSQLGGGLSGAMIVRLRITDTGGAPVLDAVAKIGPPGDVTDECDRFDRLVSRLDPNSTPRKLAHLQYGARDRAGVFYGLADGFDLTAFQVAGGESGRPVETVRGVAFALRRWSERVPETRREIREIRRRLMSDGDLAEVVRTFSLAWIEDFESKYIQTRWCCVHGDLHGSNVLTSATGQSVIIDFGDVGEGPASLDPVTLELCLLFHPQSPIKGLPWPSRDNSANWGNLTRYLAGCPCAAFIEECRVWARSVAAGNREIAACAYSYLVRQLKYDDTDKPLALSLLGGVRAFFDAT